MKKWFILFGLLLGSSKLYAQEQKIEAYKSPFYVGKNVMACGELAEINRFKSGYYLNLDKKYPEQSLAIVIWDTDYKWFLERFKSFEGLIGKRLCVRGKIEDYKNNLQIQAKNPQFLRIMQ